MVIPSAAHTADLLAKFKQLKDNFAHVIKFNSYKLMSHKQYHYKKTGILSVKLTDTVLLINLTVNSSI